MTYVKMKLWLDGLGRGHHCMGDDETTEDTYGRVFVGQNDTIEKCAYLCSSEEE